MNRKKKQFKEQKRRTDRTEFRNSRDPRINHLINQITMMMMVIAIAIKIQNESNDNDVDDYDRDGGGD